MNFGENLNELIKKKVKLLSSVWFFLKIDRLGILNISTGDVTIQLTLWCKYDLNIFYSSLRIVSKNYSAL